MNLPRLIFAACIVLIAGCHTPDALRMKSPSLELSSSASAKIVANCISEKWRGAPDGNTSVNLQRSNDEYHISMTNLDLNNTLLVADVKEQQGGSSTRYVNGYLFNAKKYDLMVIDCQIKESKKTD